MGQNDDRKWILALLQFLPLGSVIQQLYDRKLKFGPYSPTLVAKAIRPPTGIVVAQYRETGHFPIILIENAAVVNIHPPGKFWILRSLHLDVDQNPLLLAAFQPDFDQSIDEPLADSPLPHDLP